MKLLILGYESGTGQTIAARALREEAEKAGHEVFTADLSSFQGETGKKKNALSRRVEKMTESSSLALPFLFSGSRYAGAFGRAIGDGGYDAILAIHPHAMEALSALLRRGETLPACFGVFCDYALPPLFRASELGGYFLPHWSMTEDLAEKGILREKLVPCGAPLPERLSAVPGKDEARNFLWLPRDETVFLLFADGMNTGNAVRILDELLERFPEKARITVMAGRESEERDELSTRYQGESRVMINAVPERFELYLAAGDVLIARPDGVLSSGAALAGIPTVLLPALPGTAEAKNADFFAGREMALKAQGARDAVRKAERLVRDGALGDRMKAMQRRGSVRAGAGEILREIAQGI